jgi:hypothetical protein
MNTSPALARFRNTLAELRSGDVEGYKELLASAQWAIAQREPLAADAAAKAKAAKDRLAKVDSRPPA